MLFTFSITAPANTPEAAPATADMKLHGGVLTKISVLIPKGHHCAARLAIRHGATQIIPWGDQQWIRGDGVFPSWEPDIELPGEPVTLTAAAWNAGVYPHTFYIFIWMDPEPTRLPVALISRVLKRLDNFLRRVLGA